MVRVRSPVADAPGRGRPSHAEGAGVGSPRWIVCFGATRDVDRGQVMCPRQGTVSPTDCLACHLLVTIAAERDPQWACATAE